MLLPKSIQIQTIDYCNRKCPWCPNSKMEKSFDNLMPVEVFATILANLSENNYQGNLHLYLMGEPLFDPRIREFISGARKMFPENNIFISTNGDNLNGPASVNRLLDAGLTWMAISDYDGNGKFAYTAMFPNVVVTALSQLEQSFYNRGGHVDVQCSEPQKMCQWVFSKAYINYRGDVILCCSDYDYKIVFGNVMDKPFGEIYNSKDYRAYRKAHAMGDGKNMPLCNTCNGIV